MEGGKGRGDRLPAMMGLVPGSVRPASGRPRIRLTVSEPKEALSRATYVERGWRKESEGVGQEWLEYEDV